MKNNKIILLIVMLFLLCVCLVGCGLFDSNNNPGGGNGGDDDKKYDIDKDLGVLTEDVSYEYTGQPITPTVVLRYRGQELASVSPSQPHSDLTVEYRNNVEIGEATVIVTAKSSSKKFSGTAETHFDITPIRGNHYADNFAALKQYLAKGSYYNVYLGADVEIPAGESVEVFPTTRLYVMEHNLVNRGEVVNRGKVYVGTADMTNRPNCDLVNYGTFVNAEGASIVFAHYGSVINHGQFDNNGGAFSQVNGNTLDNYFYTETRIDYNFSGKMHQSVRKPITSEEFSLEQDSFAYNGNTVSVKLCCDVGGRIVNVPNNDDEYVYTGDRVNAGTFTVTITAGEHNRYCYGQRTFDVTITPSSFSAMNTRDFLEALKSPNYSSIAWDPNTNQSFDEITVLPNVTVTIKWVRQITTINLGENSVLNAYTGNGTAAFSASDGSVVMAEGAELNIYGKAIFYNTVQGGKINIRENAEVYFDKSATTSNAEIYNEGGVYADFDLSFVTGDGEKIVRQQLSVDNLTISDLEYTGKAITVAPTFQYSTSSKYSFYYSMDGGDYQYAYPIERGNYQGELVFHNTDKHYKGSVEFAFAIVRGKITVTSTSALQEAMNTDNYDRYEINNWELNSPFAIGSGATVTVNTLNTKDDLTVYGTLEVGTLTNNADLTVFGTLKVDTCVNNASRSIIVENGGVIVLNNNFYNVDHTSQLTLNNGSTFENNGAAYLCYQDIPEITTGVKYVRERNLEDAVITNFGQAVYGGNVTPTFSMFYNDEGINKATGFEIKYSRNTNRTAENGATVSVAASLDNKYYYGQATGNFTVEGGTTVVTTYNQLLAALNNMGNDGLCNWAVIETGKEMYLSAIGNLDNYHVCAGTTLKIKHNIHFSFWSNQSSKFNFCNDGIVEFHDGAKFDNDYAWANNGVMKGTGQFHMYATETDHLNFYTYITFSYICLVDNIRLRSSYVSLYAAPGGTVVDLNGYSIRSNSFDYYLDIYPSADNSVTIKGKGSATQIEPIIRIKREEGQVYLQNLAYHSIDKQSTLESEGRLIMQSCTKS